MTIGIRLMLIVTQLDMEKAAKDSLEEVNELEYTIVRVRYSSPACFNQQPHLFPQS